MLFSTWDHGNPPTIDQFVELKYHNLLILNEIFTEEKQR